MVASLSFSLLSLLLPVIVLAGLHGSPLTNRHRDLAPRQISHTGARLTFYDGNGALGSCGKPVNNDAFTVALNAGEMNTGMCFVPITITCNGKTARATIVDTCPGCPFGGLDLTPSLFEHFAPTGVGVLFGDWETDDSASAPPPAQSSTPALHPPSGKPTSTLPPSRKPTSTLPPSQPTSTHPPSSKPTSTLPPSLSPTSALHLSLNPTSTLPPSLNQTSTLPPSLNQTSTLPPSRQPTSTLTPSRPPISMLPLPHQLTSALPASLKPTSTLHSSNGAASRHVELTGTVLSSLLVCLVIVLNNHIVYVVFLTCTSG